MTAQSSSTGDGWSTFTAESAYVDSMLRSAMGDVDGMIKALTQAVAMSPAAPLSAENLRQEGA